MTASGWVHQHFAFRRVKWPSFEEAEDWTQIVGGSIEMSSESDLKMTGSLTFDGIGVPDDHDMVRVYYGYEEAGRKVFEPLATLMFSVTEPCHNGLRVSGSMSCQSVLSVLSSKCYGEPFTVTAGTQVVQKAIDMAESVGLMVGNPDPSAYTLGADHTFDATESDYLTIINWLLSAAGYSPAWVDAMGVVQFTPRVEPTERGASLTLRDDRDSIMMPEMVRRSDYAGTPNVVKLRYSTDEETLVAIASNVDEKSRASIQQRGFEVTHVETVSELAGEEQSGRLEELKSMSVAKLKEKSSDVEYVDGSCQYVKELFPGNAIRIDYVMAGIDWAGSVTSVNVSLSKGMPTSFSARKFLVRDLKIDVDGRAG